LLTAERESAKAAFLEYSSHSYYEEQKDREIQQNYYKNNALEKDSIHRLIETTHKNQLNYAPPARMHSFSPFFLGGYNQLLR